MLNETFNGRQRYDTGTIVKHFKREILEKHEELRDGDMRYLYVILAHAQNTETGEIYVVYCQLYGDQKVWVRPADMFYSKVDTVKYPNVSQVYRFIEVEV